MLLVFALLTVLQPPAEPTPAGRSVLELKAFYQQHCVRCHGADGTALGPDGKRLRGRDFTDAQKQAKATDEGMARTLRRGILFGAVMPGYGKDLSEAEALRMVREILRPAAKGKVIAPE